MSKANLSFKKAIISELQNKLDTSIPLHMNWACSYCGDQHQGNLFKKAATLRTDHTNCDHTADIALFDKNEKLLVAIHLLKNKKVDEKLNAFYEEQRVIYLQLQTTEEPVKSIGQPLFVGTCFNPRCAKCDNFQQKNELFIIDAPCWKCDQPMKVAVICAGLSRGGTTKGPSAFTQKEITFAREKGVIIETHYSKTVQESYLANTCPSCQTFVGEFFLFTEYYNAAESGYYHYEKFDVGYRCDHCVEASWNS